jgi:diacylglycerol kinase (ATP)
MKENKTEGVKQEKKTVDELKKGSFIDAWVNAFNGIIYATTTQGNIRKQLLIAVAVMLVSLLFNLTRAEFLCLMFTVILIILAEMFNTAIETVVDLYTDLYHPKAKIAKDVAAGGVVITAVNALIVAYFLFFDKISDIGLNFIRNLANSPVHMAFIGVFLIIILIVSLKAASFSKKHKLLKNGFSPSGQAAMAFGATTIIWLSTTNIVVLTLSFVMAILVCVTRIEAKKKTLCEVIFGALTGIAVIALLYGLADLFLKIF